ncbi:uncharacterized protein METZ01_LOCUS249473 [marine metagenome]|uniref:Uncharacterized protein n=1 Tax=marine metagenome TaxID=408172 RepID=A0A382IBJ2_9ZZZZ
MVSNKARKMLPNEVPSAVLRYPLIADAVGHLYNTVTLAIKVIKGVDGRQGLMRRACHKNTASGQLPSHH